MGKSLFAYFGKAVPLALIAWVFKSKLLLGAVGAVAAAVLWFGSYRGHVTGFGEGVAPVAARAAAAVAAGLPGYDETGLNPVVVFPFVGPKGAVMADLVRDAIDASGRYDVIGKGAVEEAFRYLQMDLPQLNETDARRYAEQLKAGAAVTGRMLRVDELAAPPALLFSVVMRSTEGERRWTLEYPDPAAAPVPEAGGESSGASVFSFDMENPVLRWLLTAFAFLVLALCTPFLLFPLSRSILDRESNAANAGLLFVFAALDAGLLAYLIAGLGDGWPLRSTIIVIVAFVAALWLNYVSCSILERGRK